MTIQISLLSLSIALLSASLFTTSAEAAPLVSIGDNTDVFFNGSSKMRWDSNVFRNEDSEESDLIWTISPGFDINVGRGLSNVDFNVITRYDIVRHNDIPDLDSEMFHILAKGSYESSKLDLNGSLSFDEYKMSSGDVNVPDDLVAYEVSAVRLNGEYSVSPKFSFGAGFDYSERAYKNDGKSFEGRFADRETTQLPFDVFYELTPKVDLSLGYTYTATEVGERISGLSNLASYDTNVHYFNIGARGDLLPKLSGFFKVGYKVRDVNSTASNRGSNGMLGLDAKLTWAATPKVTTGLNFSRDFGIGGVGSTTENSSVDVWTSYSISSQWSSRLNASYSVRDYESEREDSQSQLGASLTYVPSQLWQFSGGYSYSENDSNAANSSYQSHTLSVTANLRY